MSERSKDEVRELAAKGGRKSGETRRRKKQLAEIAHTVIGSKLDPDSKVYKTVRSMASDLDEEDVTVGALMVTGQANAAAKGNPRAFAVLTELDAQVLEDDEAYKYRMSPLDITIDFLEPYRAIWDTLEGNGNLREVIFRGGRGGGKSSFVAELAYEVMMRDPTANVIYLRRYRSDIKVSIYSQFLRVLQKHGVRGWHIARDHMTRTDTGTGVYFFAANNPIQAKSFTVKAGHVALLILEECNELQGLDYVEDAELTYLRANGDEGTKQMAVMVYNPAPSQQDWMNVYAEEVRNTPDILVADCTFEHVPRSWLGERFFQQAEWLRQNRPEQYANKMLGEVTGTGGELFQNVTQVEITDAQVDAWEQKGWVHQGVDWGFEHPNVFVRVAYDPERDIVYPIFEKYQRHANATKFQEGIRRFRANETICDSAEPDKIADWLDLGWNAYEAVKRWRGGGRTYAWEWLRSVRSIAVDLKRTPNLAHEFMTLEFERLNDGTYTTAYPDVGEDGVMATVYALNRVIVASKSRIPEYKED